MPTSPEEFTYAGQANFNNLRDRYISKKTCEVYGVKSIYDASTEKYIHLYPYFNEKKELKAQKVRDFRKPKDDPMHMRIDRVDDTQFADCLPFGSQAFDLSRYRYVTVCEGETDAMAAYGLLGSKYPVLSINTGAGSAKRELMKWGHILEQCENIILCFDNDEAGQKAAQECQQLFFDTNCKIMEIPRGLKDACEVLAAYQEDKTIMEEFQKNFWRAKEYRPEGVISGQKAYELMISEEDTECLASPWKGLDKKTGGNRTGELWTWTAGSGQGKSQIIRELIHHFYKKTEWRMGS
jgi:twinkle protein